MSTLAEEMGVKERTLGKMWDAPNRKPFKETWALYRAWFGREERGEAHTAPPAGAALVVAAASDAAMRDAMVMVALSKIQERAEGILEDLRTITGKQERHVQAFDPWVALEAQGLARDIDRQVVAHVEQEAAKELAAREAEQAAKDSGTPRRRRKRG
jgi:hypothetical protein